MGPDLSLSCATDDPGSTQSRGVNPRAIPPPPWCPTLLLLLPCISEEIVGSKSNPSLKQHELFPIHQHFPEPLLESPGEFLHLSSTGVVPPCRDSKKSAACSVCSSFNLLSLFP